MVISANYTLVLLYLYITYKNMVNANLSTPLFLFFVQFWNDRWGKMENKGAGEKNIFKREGENGIKNGCTCLKMASFRVINFLLFRLCIFFVIFIVICLYVFMSIFLAVVYNNYRSNLKNEVHEAIR